MYCEVVVKHRAVITEQELQTALRGRLGASIELDDAYAMSALYRRHRPAHSLDAFETLGHCFVIVRKVNSRFSTYHVEGNDAAVSVQTLLHSVQDFAGLLLPVLNTAPATPAEKARSLTVQLFEDNGRETGMEGKLITWSSTLSERFAWSSLRSDVIAFATAALLVWLGLKKEPLKAAIYSFGFVLVLTLLESVVGYFLGRGKIKWKLRQT
jgi:hypothetical protein